MQTDVTFYKNALIRIVNELPAEQVSEIFTFALFIKNRSQTESMKTSGLIVKSLPAERLETLSGLVAWGGDAVIDTERLYESC